MKTTLLAALPAFAMLFGSCSGENKPEETTDTQTPQATSVIPVDTQVVFCLSMISNLPASLCWKTDDVSAAADSIIKYVTPMMDSTLQYATQPGNGSTFSLSNWSRVWGPAVIAGDGDPITFGKPAPKVPLSSMTIFKDRNSNNYVVGIEATNPYCPYDWDSLDLNVALTHRWYYDTTTSGYLSRGTWLGINDYLLKLRDIKQGTTAVHFLDSIIRQGNDVNIVVTGHSLGGALSPVFALYMLNEAKNITGSKANIYCMSTAGPTPGDTQFAAYYDSALGKNTIRLWNTLDVVPRAWVTNLMQEIKSNTDPLKQPRGLYGDTSNSVFFDSAYSCDRSKPAKQPVPFKAMRTPEVINTAIGTFINKAGKSGVTYGPVCGGGSTFTGITQDSLYIDVPPEIIKFSFTSLFPNCDKFFGQVGNQHVAAYTAYYKIKGIHEYMRTRVQTNYYSAVNWNCRKDANTTPVSFSGTDTASHFMSILYKCAWQ